ncbi:MAG: ATP-binding cassette domain-containing protein [Anaerolineae bacterium]|nr:ATP-binding cassette domain-containing protein [Anaerolineae bacterium]
MELLTVAQLTQHFGAVPALSNINFTLESGEILGVVGQRGAGKSTLFKLLSGVYLPSSGTITFAGKRVVFNTVSQAQQLGLVAVQQQTQLINSMNVLHNVFLGREIRGRGGLKRFPQEAQMLQATRELLTAFDMSPDLAEEYVVNLSDEQRQVVALARALCHPCRLLLLDNALAALNFARQRLLLERIKELAAQQVSIILSSDDLKQIFAITDRILVLYQGRQIALRYTSETTPREIVELIVGSNRQERVTPVIWAFENYHYAQQQAEQLRQAQLELQQSLEEKDSLNRQLIKRLGNQVEALNRLNLALQESGRRTMDEREAERKALARELHDQIIQDLLSYTYQVEEAENNATEESQRLELAQIHNGIRQVVGNLRQVCSDLRPPTIDNHGLPAAIRSLTSQWSKQNGIPVELQIDPELGRLPEPIELSVFRIIQEGLRNIRKHAVATRVTLTLQRLPTASLAVRLVDNGHGIEEPMNLAELVEQKHFGLVGIGERVSLLDGTLKISSSPGGGLELNIEIPSPYPSIRN